MSEKIKKLNDSSVVRVTTAAASSLLPIVDSASGTTTVIEYQKLKAQLKAELLNDMQIGGLGGNIASFTVFPDYQKLCDLGYTTDENKTNTEAYFKGLLSWIADKNLAGKMLLGKANPNNQGLFMFSSASAVVNNLPSYSAGLYITYSHETGGKLYKIGTYNGVFYLIDDNIQ